MMTVAEKMAARLENTPPSEHGTPCRWCETTALACQLHFVLTDGWCCTRCRADGAAAAHTPKEEAT